jgi:hypothetical protein
MEVQMETLTEEQAAKFLGVPLKTLRYFRLYGKGPRYIAYGQRTRVYRVADLVAFQDSCAAVRTTAKAERAAISA